MENIFEDYYDIDMLFLHLLLTLIINFSFIFLYVLPKLFSSCFRYRSSHQSCFVRKGVLKNFKKFTGKHLCQSLFFNTVLGLRTPFYIEHL